MPSAKPEIEYAEGPQKPLPYPPYFLNFNQLTYKYERRY
jgi:hypothetical protein